MRGSERRSAGTGQGLPLMSKCELTTRQARGTGPGHPGGGGAGLPRAPGPHLWTLCPDPGTWSPAPRRSPDPSELAPTLSGGWTLCRGLRGVRARRRPAGGWGRACQPALRTQRPPHAGPDRPLFSASADQHLHVFRVPHGGHLHPQHHHRQQADRHGPPGGRAGPGGRGRGPARRVQHVRGARPGASAAPRSPGATYVTARPSGVGGSRGAAPPKRQSREICVLGRIGARLSAGSGGVLL